MMIAGLAAALLAVASVPLPVAQETWVTDGDYPPSALRAEAQGVTAYRLGVDASGFPTGCDVLQTAGFAALDDRTCVLLMRRARFQPATDRRGRAVAGSFSGRLAWKIHDDGPPPKSN